jgi:pyrrolidone-carboxylate peptidase
MPRILVTGFEPFGRWSVNSSWEAVRHLAGRHRGVRAECLPVEHFAAAEAIRELVARGAPQVVLLTGLAADPVPRLERLGRPGPLACAGGPPVRRGRWPWRAAHARIAARGLPLRLSADAGGYVCDSTYWAALGTSAPLVAFLHLPPVGPTWTPARSALAIEAALEAAQPRRGITS